MAIATATDYAQLQKEARKNALGISEWERYFLQPLKTSLENEVAQTQQKMSTILAALLLIINNNKDN